MRGDVSFKVEGFRDMDAALQDLKVVTARSVARRALKRAGAPVADAMNAAAPRGETKNLAGSYAVSTRLNKAQRRRHRRGSRVEVHVGTDDPAGVQQEFGNARHGAQPHARPAWAGTKLRALEILIEALRDELTKAVARARRKAERAARKGRG